MSIFPALPIYFSLNYPYLQFIFLLDILGSLYYSYNATGGFVSSYGFIRQKFHSFNASISGSVPVNMDAAFFDYRQEVKLIYFFKGDKVSWYADKEVNEIILCKY